MSASTHKALAFKRNRSSSIQLHYLVDFVETAVAEKIAALTTESYLEALAKRGSREKYEAVLAKVPDVAPESHDQ